MPAHWLQVESCRAGFKSGGKDQLNALFSVGTMKADTDSASAESVKVIQGRVAHGTLYVRLTCPTMDNRHSPFPRCAMASNLVHCGIESGRKQNNVC